MLKVRDLQLQFGSNKSALNFEIKPGTTTWLRGDNGAGKSTLLLTILGFVEATGGEIEFDQSADSFAYAPQKSAFAFGISTERVLELAKVDTSGTLIEKLGIHTFLGTSITELSGGEVQRVQIAIALSQNANHVFLDEPFSSQDSQSIERIKEAMHSYLKLEKALIVASHLEIEADQILSLE